MHDFNIRLKWTKSIIRPILNKTNAENEIFYPNAQNRYQEILTLCEPKLFLHLDTLK